MGGCILVLCEQDKHPDAMYLRNYMLNNSFAKHLSHILQLSSLGMCSKVPCTFPGSVAGFGVSPLRYLAVRDRAESTYCKHCLPLVHCQVWVEATWTTYMWRDQTMARGGGGEKGPQEETSGVQNAFSCKPSGSDTMGTQTSFQRQISSLFHIMGSRPEALASSQIVALARQCH